MPPGRRIDAIGALTGSGARGRAVGLIAAVFVAFAVATFAVAAEEPAEEAQAEPVRILRVLVIDQ